MGMEVCCTLGMIEKQQAEELKKAGLTAYNHNLDTSREYYPNIITTRSYDDRLQTLQHVREAGISICSGDLFFYIYLLTLFAVPSMHNKHSSSAKKKRGNIVIWCIIWWPLLLFRWNHRSWRSTGGPCRVVAYSSHLAYTPRECSY